MGKLADALAEAKNAPRKTRIDEWVESLPSDDQAALIAAATDPAYSNLSLRRIMSDNGYTPSKETVATWRRKHGFVS